MCGRTYLLAALCILADTRLDKSILVTMPYADALFGLSDWFRQLWAESLGKRLSLDNEVVFTGQTPIKALGAYRPAFADPALYRGSKRQTD